MSTRSTSRTGRSRPGRIPGDWGFCIAIVWTVLSLLVAAILGPWAFGAAVVGLALAWAYSAPPLRLKRNGWWGNAACAACYEGLPWFTGAAVMAGARAGLRGSSRMAALYSVGAHGIMTLNDFKSVEGDRADWASTRCRCMLGVERAARLACVRRWRCRRSWSIVLLLSLGLPLHAAGVAVLLLAQVALMRAPAGQPARARRPGTTHRHDAVRARHAGQRLRAARRSERGR